MPSRSVSGHPAGKPSPRLKVNQAPGRINNLPSLPPIRSAFEGVGMPVAVSPDAPYAEGPTGR